MFSNHIEEKLDSFEKVIYYFSPNDIDFVCKYDKSKTFQLGLEKDYPCDYFIAKKNNENNLYLLGLVRQGNMYKPMSNILVLSDEQQIAKFKGLLMNQVITYPNSIAVENMVTGFGNKAHLSNSTKLEKIKSLRNYARSIKGVSIDVSFDFQYIVNGFQMKDNKINIYKMICQQFMQTIAAHEVFLMEQLDESIQSQMDSEMIQLIETYNNESCQSDSNKAQMTYSDLLNKYNALAKQVLELEAQLDVTRQESYTNLERIQILKEENAEYKSFQEDILAVVQRKRNKTLANNEDA